MIIIITCGFITANSELANRSVLLRIENHIQFIYRLSFVFRRQFFRKPTRLLVLHAAHCSIIVVEGTTWATTAEPTIAPRNISK